MPTYLTLDDCERIAADFHHDEAARNATWPSAIRAVYQLVSLLADLGAADRASILALLDDEVQAQCATA